MNAEQILKEMTLEMSALRLLGCAVMLTIYLGLLFRI